jgi:hypothetical protein
MKPVKIEQLLKVAMAAPAPAIEPMPQYLQTRILASFPAQSGRDLMPSLAVGLRLGLGLAFAIMIACLAWNYQDLSLQPDNDIELATVEAHLDMQL